MTATALLLAETRAASGGGGTIALRSLTSVSYISRTNTVLTAPAGLANNDILFALVVVAKTGGATAVTAPAGFTEIGTPTTVIDGGNFQGVFHMYWKRAASESGSYTFTHGAQNSQGVMQAFSGCLTSATPIGATSNNTGSSNVSTGTGITTTAANSWLLYQAHDWTGSGTLSPPSGMTEQFDSLLYSATELRATAGATGNRVQTNANAVGANDQWSARMAELLAA